MRRTTKHEIEGELEVMRSRMEDAHEILSEALGYEAEDEENDDELDEEGQGD